jgi:dynein heavy chain
LDAIGPIIDDPGSKFNEEDMKKQSFPASKLCAWAVNIREFNRIYKIVKPLKDEVERATADLEAK